MKKLFENKYISCFKFKNIDNERMFGFEFIVGDSSMDNYRGFKVEKARKVAKWLRKIAKKLEKLK